MYSNNGNHDILFLGCNCMRGSKNCSKRFRKIFFFPYGGKGVGGGYFQSCVVHFQEYGVFSTSWIITFLHILVCYICKTKTIYLNSPKNLSNCNIILCIYIHTHIYNPVQIKGRLLTDLSSRSPGIRCKYIRVYKFVPHMSGSVCRTGSRKDTLTVYGQLMKNQEKLRIKKHLQNILCDQHILCLYLKFFKIFRK